MPGQNTLLAACLAATVAFLAVREQGPSAWPWWASVLMAVIAGAVVLTSEWVMTQRGEPVRRSADDETTAVPERKTQQLQG